MNAIIEKFKLKNEKEDYPNAIASIENGVVFRGTNLWVLIFAIFLASLGLNVNSTAVIIGAMLISPLMGPIMGIGLGMGINDISLFRKAIQNYLIATIVALTTSTIFFILSPISDAHSEILSRTSPNIYDVLIAFFGGLAGILATSSKNKGNVIPGVAIATALMPPLCTAGYGLATLQLNYFIGAFYLFLINTVFIAVATFIIVRLLHFPLKTLQSAESEKRAKRLVWSIAFLTLLPSLYFGYDIVQQNRFSKNVDQFVANEAQFSNDYLLNKKIDPKSKNITLVYGGKEITEEEIQELKNKLPQYKLEKATLNIKQGFAYLSEQKNTEVNEQYRKLSLTLEEKQKTLKQYQLQFDSIDSQQKLSQQVYSELKVQFPQIKNAVLSPTTRLSDSLKKEKTYLVLLNATKNITRGDQEKLENWLKIRLNQPTLTLIIQK